MIDREGGGVMPPPHVNAVFSGGVWHLPCRAERARAQGDVGLGPGQTTHGMSFELRGRAHRSRQRAAAVRRRREHRIGGPPPDLDSMVQRHDPGGSVRCGSDGRRSVCSTRRREQFRHRAGACRRRAAQRRRRHIRACDKFGAQERSSAAARRGQCRPPSHTGIHHQPRQRQPRDRARAPLHPGRRKSVVDRIGALRRHSCVQRAEDAGAIGGSRRQRCRCRRRRAGRGSVVRHARSHRGPSARKDRRRDAVRRDPRARARGCELGRQHPEVSAHRRIRFRSRPMPRSATAIPTPASSPASSRKTSRCCRRPPHR